MKKITALICLASAVAVLASCGGEKTAEPTQATAQTTATTSGTTSATTVGSTAATTAEPYDEVKKDENGNVTEKTHYNEYGKKMKYETFTQDGMPEKVYLYNYQGMPTEYTFYMYDEHGKIKTEYREKGGYDSTGLILLQKEALTYDGSGKLLSRGLSYYNDKSGVLKSANVLYYDENGRLAYEDVTKVAEYDYDYVTTTERYDTSGKILQRDERKISKTTGNITRSVTEVMKYENGVLVSITKTEPISNYTQVTVTYYSADGKMLYDEGARYNNSDLSPQIFFKITYHENGRKHESFTYGPDMKLVSYYRDDTLGKRIGMLTSRMDGETYIYSGMSDDGLTEYSNLFLDKDLKVTSGEVIEFYSKGGAKKSSTWYESTKDKTVYNFDTEGRLTSKEKYIEESILEYVKKYEYETEETGTITTYDKDGNVISKERFEEIDW